MIKEKQNKGIKEECWNEWEKTQKEKEEERWTKIRNGTKVERLIF
jgi:hypothetical protein